MLKRYFAFALLVLVIWCQLTLPIGSSEAAVQTTSSQDFALKLFTLTCKGKQSNVVVSPLSVSTALSMALHGAAGKTKEEMRKTLGFGQQPDDAIAKSNQTVRTKLLAVNPVSQLNIANGLFANKGIDFKKPFLGVNREYYGARVETLDFSDPASVKTINAWVEKETKNKIKDLLDAIPSGAFLYLINAVYFKGDWLEAFKQADTNPKDFNLLNGTKTKVQMMNKTGDFQYLRGSNFQAVMLPYKDKRLSMFVFLPDEKVGFEAFTATFTPANWQKWLSGFNQREGHIGLPRFVVEYKTELKDVLSQAGMPCAFNDKCADFSAMVDAPAVISRVLHKTYMEVNEKGTEAAAATAVEMTFTAAPANPQPPFNMVCDRPFVVAIHDSETSSILFIGTIVSPK